MPYRTMEVVAPKRPEWVVAQMVRELWEAGPRYRACVVGLTLAVYSILFGVSLLFVPRSQTTTPGWEELQEVQTRSRYQDCERRRGTWHMGPVMQWCSIDLRRSR